jgi:hypothetical protein
MKRRIKDMLVGKAIFRAGTSSPGGTLFPQRPPTATVVLLLAGWLTVLPAYGEMITLRSGTAAIGDQDPNITYVAGTANSPLRLAPFTSQDFADASNGPNAFVITPYPGWLAYLPSDPLAKWINWGLIWGTYGYPASALYAMDFDVTTTNIVSASIDFYWAVDDRLGDVDGNGNPTGANPFGVYINETPLTGFSGGRKDQESFGTADITSLLTTGTNTLYVYVRDGGAVVSGAIFTSTITVIPEPASLTLLGLSGLVGLCRHTRRC